MHHPNSMSDADFMRLALRLARRGRGRTSPNPMVGAVLARGGRVIGRGWHRRAGLPHAEIEALRDAARHDQPVKGATLYVTLEPCCTRGRTPPCTEAIIAAGVRRVVAGAMDPNPRHAGRGFEVLRAAGIEAGLLAEAVAVLPLADRSADSSVCASTDTGSRRPRSPHSAAKFLAKASAAAARVARECSQLNAAFNHWIVHRTPLVTVKAAMTLDGKIATAEGESKWITGDPARAFAMKLRMEHDAIVVGIKTMLADDPALTVRSPKSEGQSPKPLRRVVLDSRARTPLTAKVASDAHADWTTIVVSASAPKRRVTALARRVRVLVAPKSPGRVASSMIPLPWLLRKLGAEGVTSLLVEGGGEVNGAFLAQRLAQRVAFFYAPKVLGGRAARRGVAGEGAIAWPQILGLTEPRWRRLGADLMLQARVEPRATRPR